MKDLFISVTPMNDMPKGSLVYLDIKFNVTPTGAQILYDEPASLGQQITYYEQEYEQLKSYSLYRDEAQDALLRSIKCRMKKIKKDHCGA